MIKKLLSLPSQLFPYSVSSTVRWLAMVPVLGVLASCWGAAFLEFGGVPTAAFTASVLTCLGIGILVGVRLALQAISTRLPRDAVRPAADEVEVLGIGWVLVAGLSGVFGMAVFAVFTGGGAIDSAAAPGLAPPGQIGVWLWLLHELAVCWWCARRRTVPAQLDR